MLQDIIFKEISNFFDSYIPSLPERKNICVAVSGGCDSTALFYLLLNLREPLGISRLGIAHVNHGLRGSQSDADAAFVKEISRREKAPFHEKNLGPRPSNSGLEEWARGERYAFFHKLRIDEGYDWIATGHTADDQAETVIMRLMRGSGLKGLRGIAPIREDRVIRPLLHISKASLDAWLRETGKTFREDSSNNDLVFRRNYVRRKLLPVLLEAEPLAMQLLPRIAGAAYETWQALSSVIDRWIDEHVTIKSDLRFDINAHGLVEFPFIHEAIAEVLRRKAVNFERLHIEEFVSNATRKSSLFLLPGGWRYTCEEGKIIVFKGRAVIDDAIRRCTRIHEISIDSSFFCDEANICIENVRLPVIKGMAPLQYFPDNMTVFLDAGIIKGPLEFRPLKDDDAFRPLGSGEFRNVKEFLKKRKKSRSIIGVVAEKGKEIIWIPGVQINHRFRVTPQTAAILKFSCKYVK